MHAACTVHAILLVFYRYTESTHLNYEKMCDEFVWCHWKFINFLWLWWW